MRYKYIKAILIFGRLFDLDDGNVYVLQSSRFVVNSGYYALELLDNGLYRVIAQVDDEECWAKEYLYSLPPFVKSKISNYLLKNYGVFKQVQIICNILNSQFKKYIYK